MYDKLTAIKMLNPNERFTVIWDLGNRCNCDCSYCPPHRHDDFSRHATLDEMKQSVKFIMEYTDLLMQYKTNKKFEIIFTGGEPTMNPDFVELLQYLTKYKDGRDFKIGVTSNGVFSSYTAREIYRHTDNITISYHAEEEKHVKDRVLGNVRYFHNNGFRVKTNIMLHAEYWNECVEVCNKLQREKIIYSPRLIGEIPSPVRDAHLYTKEQLKWFNDQWGSPTEDNTFDKKYAIENGRPCCGRRKLGLLDDDMTWHKSSFVKYLKFSGWYCSVNWFFLHLEQQTDTITHHQTCQARFDRTRGAIGTISNYSSIIEKLEQNIQNKKMPLIICPLKKDERCRCGLCTPKSCDVFIFKELIEKHIDVSIFKDLQWK